MDVGAGFKTARTKPARTTDGINRYQQKIYS